MRDDDRQRFVTLLCGIADYYGKELSKATIDLYWRGWQQFDITDIERALWQHTQSPDAGQFMPKIADITRMLHGRTEDQAAQAWSKVDAAVRIVGTYADVVFDDALIHRVIVELGGWIWLGKQIDNEWPFIAKRFENLYRSYRIRADSPSYPPCLIGVGNAHNATQGHATVPPILLGDPSKAQAVQRGGSSMPLLAMNRAGCLMNMQNMAPMKIMRPMQMNQLSIGHQPKANQNTKEAA